MPIALQLLAYAVCCAGILALVGPGSRTFWLITLLLVVTAGTYALLESYLWALQATWQAPSTRCVLGLDSWTLPRATLAQVAIVLLLAGLGRGTVWQVAAGSIVGALILLRGVVLYHPA